MRKINYRSLLAQSLIVAGVILMGLSYLGKSESPQFTESSIAVVRPIYNDAVISDGRLSVNLDSVISLAQINQGAQPNRVYYFVAFILGILFLNNVWLSYRTVQERTDTEPNPEDEASFRRLHGYLSHEQKNTLAIIRSRMEIAKDYETLAYIDKISHAMDDVLTLSDNVVAEDLEVVDVTILVAEVCDDYQPLAKIEYLFDDAPNQIHSKYQWIYRAMSNLLDNAIKFSNGENIRVSVETKNNTVVISVRDQGIGIPEAEMEKIFQHEYRVDALKSDGYGIGLSLVNRVCDLSSGVVWVDSEEGTGTTFYLCFPELTLD